MIHLLDIGAIGVLELGLALNNTRHRREIALTSVGVIEHFC